MKEIHFIDQQKLADFSPSKQMEICQNCEHIEKEGFLFADKEVMTFIWYLGLVTKEFENRFRESLKARLKLKYDFVTKTNKD